MTTRVDVATLTRLRERPRFFEPSISSHHVSRLLLPCHQPPRTDALAKPAGLLPTHSTCSARPEIKKH